MLVKNTLKMKNNNILIIGCGGIGCELIKIMHVMQCKNITLIDYDTISISNLNRQFFFTIEDVGKYKCEVIASKYKKMNSDAKIKIHKNDVTDRKFDYNFYEMYDLVFNCLDNQEARSFVSKRCAFAKKPLIDGGSKGFLGQAWFYMTNIECYDCIEKQHDNEIPVCTIRSFPITYEHCVIWSKQYFLQALFEANEINNVDKLISEIVKEKYCIEKTLFEEIKKLCDAVINGKMREYDKDDSAMSLLCYTVAKLRAESFGICTLSILETETILGNIVPIIGTTNAIIASLMWEIGTDYCKGKPISNFFLTNNKHIINRVKSMKWKHDCYFCNAKKLLYHKNETSSLLMLFDKLKPYGVVQRIFDSENLFYDIKYMNVVENDPCFESNQIFYAAIEDKIFCILVIDSRDNTIEEIK